MHDKKIRAFLRGLPRWTLAAGAAAFLLAEPAGAQEGTAHAFQGIPRKTEAECLVAANRIAEKFKLLGFADIVSGCGTLNDDTGTHAVPIIQGTQARAFSGDTLMGPRLASAAECQAELARLTPRGAGITILEAECVKDREIDFLGAITEFWQAYVFYVRYPAPPEPGSGTEDPSVNDATGVKVVPLERPPPGGKLDRSQPSGQVPK